ncbi:MAG: sensor histidine kinase [Burkholderiales bacterium PBB3]|nr:MAG: sensor histidine kinase [Burkholderiales bacterium PBB3]
MTNASPPTHADANAATPRLWDKSRLNPSQPEFAAALCVALLCAVMLRTLVRNPFYELLGETVFVSMVSLFAFKVAGALRQTLLPVWVAQWAAVMLGAAIGPLIVQLVGTGGSLSEFLNSRPLKGGYFLVMLSATIGGSLLTLGALIREHEAKAKAEALQFALERETLQRQASDARLSLLTAQIEPHFLLNTLANVQTLVETGSPQAVPVFRSLIAYLRGAMQQLQQESASLADEERLVRSYLDIMAMRMPDRLRFSVDIDPALKDLRFPPMALLTLVENAVRHGIDPGMEGGEIAVGARPVGAEGVLIWVSDTGVGMSETASMGLGLNNLKERLKAVFGADAVLELSEQSPHGLRVDLRFRKPL